MAAQGSNSRRTHYSQLIRAGGAEALNEKLEISEANEADVLRYLSDSATRHLQYHNHKETSAWAGIGLWYALSLASLSSGRIATWTSEVIFNAITATVAAILIAALFFAYIREQFRLRRHASDVISALYALMASGLAGHRFAKDDFRVTPCRGVLASQYLPTLILDRAAALAPYDRIRPRLERIGFGLAWLALLAFLSSVWWHWIIRCV